MTLVGSYVKILLENCSASTSRRESQRGNNMSTGQLTSSFELAEKYSEIYFESFYEANKIILNASGIDHQRPTNIPSNWKVKIVGKFGLKFINPVDEDEWIKVLPSFTNTRFSFSQHSVVIYHKPAKKILKRFGMRKDPEVRILMDMKEFNQEDPGHLKILDSLAMTTKQMGSSDRALEVGRKLKNFWISVDDLILIRKKFGFQEFADQADFKKVLKTIHDELLCNCFGTYLSSSQLGAISKHNLNHYNSIRLAFHFGDDRPFIKINFRGKYRSEDGSEGLDGESSIHLDFESVLTGNFQWFQPVCKKQYAFSTFDYNLVEHPIDDDIRMKESKNRLIEYKNKKGVGYV